MPRTGWGARPPDMNNMTGFKGQRELLIVDNTAFVRQCSTPDDCCQGARMTQNNNMDPLPEGRGKVAH